MSWRDCFSFLCRGQYENFILKNERENLIKYKKFFLQLTTKLHYIDNSVFGPMVTHHLHITGNKISTINIQLFMEFIYNLFVICTLYSCIIIVLIPFVK